MNVIQPDQDDGIGIEMALSLSGGTPPVVGQPTSYDGVVVIKPWGYEFQIYDNGDCSIWLACLKPGQSVSMHCHRRKSAAFLPLSNNITFHTLKTSFLLRSGTAVAPNVFHSQSNESDEAGYFLEHEWPSEKADLLRLKDRYGRVGKGYESVSQMIPWRTAVEQLNIPVKFQAMMERVA